MAHYMHVTQHRAFLLESHPLPNWGKCIGVRPYHTVDGESVPTGNWHLGDGSLYKLDANNTAELPEAQAQAILEQVPKKQ